MPAEPTEKKQLNNFQQRVLVGLAGGALFIGAIYFDQWTFAVLFLGLTVLGIREFYQLLTLRGFAPNYNAGIVLGSALFVLIFLLQLKVVQPKALFALPPIVFFVFIAELFRKKEQPFVNIALTLVGMLYVGGSFSMLPILGFLKGYYSWQVIMGTMLLIWASDSGAYFVGKTFGKHKLFPRISPGKTWEGWVGGAFAALLVGYFLSVYFQDLNLLQWLGIAVIVSIFGVLGDLIESLLKRSLQVKDSGTLIPGHGGILDRFDSLVLVVPFIVAFLKLF
ncbi:phosphatidate cytidylyltransferase [Adhaeribacter arboris]|uniref:Phosphatidate cytidylyltransferase n=1 Tax=Adhaeribacter arboris TaxID=2072846 RepID=A0A2T2YDU0_9BACT|nr:phosphatidate cytidylyltransferase [Adhaeribacter arboris]PSR53680.1 phosphatidate cytidylyltransferase [Adhaeribacter arboris]